MADPIANVVVSMPTQLFTRASVFQACAGGSIFIGKIDTDPTQAVNQIQVYVSNEDGSLIPVSQPIPINAGGFPVYNSHVAKFVTEQGHSMTVLNAFGGQEHYFENVLKYDPDQLRQDLAAPGGVYLVNGAAKQEDLDALADEVALVKDSIYYNGKTAASHLKDMLAGALKYAKFFGDSTMYGSEPPTLARTANYPSKMFQEAINAVYNISVNITGDYAIPGTTLYDMIRGTDGSGKTFEQRLKESPCDFVFCNHGINDNQTGKDILQYRKDLINFVYTSRANNATPILVTPNPQLTIGIGTPANSKRFEAFVDVMRQVADDMAVDLVDNFYYMSRSLNIFKPIAMFPDGVHMSAAVYRQYGYNLAMPFVNARELKAPGDKAGLNSTSWFSNSTNSRIEEHGASCGETFIWEKESNSTGINFAVILDRGVKNIGINHLQWPSAGILNLYDNAASLGATEARKTTGNTASIDWDSITKTNTPMYAGLHIIGALLSQTASVGNGGTFNGVVMLGGDYSSMTDSAGNWYVQDYLYNIDYLMMNYTWAAGTEIPLMDASGTKAASLKLTGTTLRLATFANGVEVAGVNLSTSVSPAVYFTTFRINDKKLEAQVGILTANIDLGVNVSKLKLGVPSTPFTVIRQ